MTEETKVLLSDGTVSATSIGLTRYDSVTGNMGIWLATDYHNANKTAKPWNFNELVELLNDGMRFRLLKKANEIEAELARTKTLDPTR